MAREVLSTVDKARIELWTSRDMLFSINKKRGISVIPKYTKCEKVPYTHKIKDYLQSMEEHSFSRPTDKPKAVCVKLEGMIRFVWRTDVLTEKEHRVISDDLKRRLANVLIPK